MRRRTNQRKHTPIPRLAEYLAWLNVGKAEKAHARATLAEAILRASERRCSQ